MDGIFTGPGNKKSVEWYTPEWIFDELAVKFNMDPSSPHDMETCVPANIKYNIFDDGLSLAWTGRVWLNPPYGRDIDKWIGKMIDHNNGIALVFSRTDAKWCQECMLRCSAMLFIQGRIQFVPGNENKHKVGGSGAGSVFFAFGRGNIAPLKRIQHRGHLIINAR